MKQIKLKANAGQLALGTTLLIAAIVIEIGVGMGFVVFLVLNSGAAGRSSNQALTVAQAGINDALIKISRDKNIEILTPPYTVSVGSSSALVTIDKDAPVTGKDTVISTGQVGIKKRRLQAIIPINSDTGKIEIESLTEIQL